MSKPILQLQNSANWSQIWTHKVDAVGVPNKPGFTVPIDPIVVPYLLENHIIAIHATSLTAKSRWRFAGTVTKKIATGITVGANLDTSISDSRAIYLDQINLFNFTPFTPTYALQVNPPWWFKDIWLTFWIYTGIESDSITEQLNRIEFAIDEVNR